MRKEEFLVGSVSYYYSPLYDTFNKMEKLIFAANIEFRVSRISVV